MAAAAAAPAAPGEMGGDATSLRLLQLKDTFRRMVAVGTDCVDQQVRQCHGQGRAGVAHAAARRPRLTGMLHADR